MVEAISFDFYGTLVDWRPIWTSVTARIVEENRLPVTPENLAIEWRAAQQPMLETREFTPYNQYIESALEVLCEKYRIRNKGYGKLLFSKYEEMLPFPEVPETLRKLEERFPLAVCSNSSRDSFNTCARRLPISFDHVFLSDETKVNKPHPRMYENLIKTLGVSKELILHVASSQMDVRGATKAGLTVCWINRLGQERSASTPKPTIEIRRLDELPGFLL